MSDSNARIRLKIGQLEIDYEGDSGFLKDQLISTVSELISLQNLLPEANNNSQISSLGEDNNLVSKNYDQSTDTIANIIGTSSGTDLIIAAAAHLHFVKNKQKFTRPELV